MLTKQISFIVLSLLASSIAVIHANTSPIDEALKRGCLFAYYPSLNEAHIQIELIPSQVRLPAASKFGKSVNSAFVSIIPAGGGKPLAQRKLAVNDGISEALNLPLPSLDGAYEARFVLKGSNEDRVIIHPFERQHYFWENNQIGVTDQVFAPFEPLQASTSGEIKIVDRIYQLNGLGLLNSIESLDEELLASPMQLHYQLASGQTGSIQPGKLKLISHNDAQAIYEGRTESPIVNIDAHITVEFDGMSKVNWKLTPGSQEPATINSLWIDAPLKVKMSPLMHNVTDTNRIHHAGYLPEGEGVIWSSAQARRQGNWQNTFNAYLWMGQEARGLAWYAENDRDWLTERGGSKEAIQQIVRQDDVNHMQIYIINTPSKLTRPHEIVFAFQSSPTKPRSSNWRALYPPPPGMSGPVNAWGAFQCSDKYPYKDDWSVVEKILEGRETGQADFAWLREWSDKNNPPLVHGRIDWAERTGYFAAREANLPKDYPTLIYFEEMRASFFRPEWKTFQDDWGDKRFTNRTWPEEDVMRRGFNMQGKNPTNFSSTYRDFGLHYANEWLKRGIGLYFDNTYAQLLYDPNTSSAYVTEDGSIQPALGLFNQREYMKRIWNTMNVHHGKTERPLNMAVHMTNTFLLPLQTFATIQLDHELPLAQPVSPDYIRTEMTGIQCGNLPHALFAVSGKQNKYLKPLSKKHRQRIEWAMRRVHEIYPSMGFNSDGGPLETYIRNFGYGSDQVEVYQYWLEDPAVTVSDDDVKWLALRNNETGEGMIVLSSWNHETASPHLSLENAFPSEYQFFDAETGLPIEASGEHLNVDLKGPYGMKILYFTPDGSKPNFQWPLRKPEEIAQDLVTPNSENSSGNKNKVSAAISTIVPKDPFRGVDKETTVFSDDFENGFDSDWSATHKASIIEDPKQSGNHIARFKEPRGNLISPAIMPLIGKDGTTEMSANYGFRFRFRIGPYEEDPDSSKQNASFLTLSWRIDPENRELGASQFTWLQIWRSSKKWRFGGPYTKWGKQSIRFSPEKMVTKIPHGPTPYAFDHQWHEFEVQVLGDRTVISLDGERIFDARDDRTLQGGFSIGSLWDSRATPEYIDIDNVVAWRIDEIKDYAEPGSGTIKHLAAWTPDAPTIDGNLDDSAWKKALADGAAKPNWYPLYTKDDSQQLHFDRTSRLAYDDKYLYIAMFAEADDPMKLKVEESPFNGDCLEIHLRNGEEYMHMGLGPTGKTGMGLFSTVKNWDQIQSATAYHENGWSAEIAIPWEIIKVNPYEDTDIIFNLAANAAYQGNGKWIRASLTPKVFNVRDAGPPLKLLPAAWPNMVTPLRLTSKPTLDGELDDPAWSQNVEAATIDKWHRLDGKQLTRPRRAVLAYDEENLYVATIVSIDGENSVSEDMNSGDTLQLDFAGHSLGVSASGDPLPILIPYLIPSEAGVSTNDSQLVFELAAPWSQIGGMPEPGEVIAINLAGNDSQNGNISWQKVRDLRDIENFGWLKMPSNN